MVYLARAIDADADDGTEVVMEPGDLFAIPPGARLPGSSATSPTLSLHFLGAEHYAGE